MRPLSKINTLIRHLILSKWFVLILALIVGIISFFPYYQAKVSLGQDYKGMPLLIQDSEGEYLGRVHEILEGNYSVASSVFFEYKNWPSLVPPIGEWLYFIPTYLFGVTVIEVNMFYKFLLPVLLFLLSYVFIKKLTEGSVFWAIVGALVITLGFDLPSFHFLKKLLLEDFSGYISPWTRPINPITGMLFLTAYLIFIYKIFAERSKNFIIPGVLLCLMVGYFFSFAYAGILTALLLVFTFFNSQKSESKLYVWILITAIIGVLILIGAEVFGLISGKVIGGLNDPRLQGLFYTRLPLINKTSLLFTAMFLLLTSLVYFLKKEKLWIEKWWVFCFALLVTNQIVFNIQIILGWTIWPQHFSQYTNAALSFSLITFLHKGVSPFFPKISRFCGWVLVSLLVLLLVKTIPNNRDILPILTDFQKQAGVMEWLGERDDRGCVVFVVQDNTIVLELNRFIPAFTNCDVYNSYNIYQGVPRDRVFHNLLLWIWMKGVTEKELPDFLSTENVWIRAYMFRDWRDMFCCEGDKWIADLGTKTEWEEWYNNVTLKIEASYPILLSKDIPGELKKYRLDYVIVDKSSRVRGDLKSKKWLNLVYSDDRYDIYSF